MEFIIQQIKNGRLINFVISPQGDLILAGYGQHKNVIAERTGYEKYYEEWMEYLCGNADVKPTTSDRLLTECEFAEKARGWIIVSQSPFFDKKIVVTLQHPTQSAMDALESLSSELLVINTEVASILKHWCI